MHIRPVLDTDEEHRITPDGVVYESAFDLVKAWTDEYKVGVCGIAGKRGIAHPTSPLPDLSNLLASRTVKKRKGHVKDQEE